MVPLFVIAGLLDVLEKRPNDVLKGGLRQSTFIFLI